MISHVGQRSPVTAALGASDVGLHGEHKVLDCSGLPLKSGEEATDFEDVSQSDAVRGFVVELASHAPWDGDIKKEKKRFDALRHKISKSYRVISNLDRSVAQRTMNDDRQVFPPISAILRTYNSLVSQGVVKHDPALKSLFIRKEVTPRPLKSRRTFLAAAPRHTKTESSARPNDRRVAPRAPPPRHPVHASMPLHARLRPLHARRFLLLCTPRPLPPPVPGLGEAAEQQTSAPPFRPRRRRDSDALAEPGAGAVLVGGAGGHGVHSAGGLLVPPRLPLLPQRARRQRHTAAPPQARPPAGYQAAARLSPPLSAPPFPRPPAPTCTHARTHTHTFNRRAESVCGAPRQGKPGAGRAYALVRTRARRRSKLRPRPQQPAPFCACAHARTLCTCVCS